MQLNTLKRNTPNYKSMPVGRGGKRGKTSGRGTKGQNARAGRKFRPALRDVIKKLPKLRGYAFGSAQVKPVAISLKTISEKFDVGAQVTPATLVEKGILRLKLGKTPRVKIMSAEVSKKLDFSGCLISAKAKEMIEKAGGKVD